MSRSVQVDTTLALSVVITKQAVMGIQTAGSNSSLRVVDSGNMAHIVSASATCATEAIGPYDSRTHHRRWKYDSFCGGLSCRKSSKVHGESRLCTLTVSI